MNSLQLIDYTTRRQLDRFFEAVRSLPADKLEWKQCSQCRTALDQVQEVATVFRGIPKAVVDRKLEFTPESFAESVVERQKVTDLAELERMTREGTEELLAFVRTVSESELGDKVEMPWPGEFTVADLLGYHSWNMGYHEGQIYFIGGLLAKEGQS